MKEKINPFLVKLLNAPSPSGYESPAREVFDKFCYQHNLQHEFTDSIGNSAFSVGKEGGVPFMVSEHIDEIALQVQHIDDDGFIHFIKDGGIDPKTLAGRNVVICTNGRAYILHMHKFCPFCRRVNSYFFIICLPTTSKTRTGFVFTMEKRRKFHEKTFESQEVFGFLFLRAFINRVRETRGQRT